MDLVDRLFWPTILSADQPNALLWVLAWHIAPLIIGAGLMVLSQRGPNPEAPSWILANILGVGALSGVLSMVQFFGTHGFIVHRSFISLDFPPHILLLGWLVAGPMLFLPQVFIGAFLASLTSGKPLNRLFRLVFWVAIGAVFFKFWADFIGQHVHDFVIGRTSRLSDGQEAGFELSELLFWGAYLGLPVVIGVGFVLWRDSGNPAPYRQQWGTMGWLTVMAAAFPILIFAVGSWFQGAMEKDAFSRVKQLVLRPALAAYAVLPLVFAGAFIASLATRVPRPLRFSGVWLLFLAAFAPLSAIVAILLACAALNSCL